MDLTPGQDAALEMVRRFLADPDEAVAVLTGYAGTGKSTLLGELPGLCRVTALAPTGKAALRVQEAGLIDAKTIHRFRYNAVSDEDGDVAYVPRPLSDYEDFEGLLVVDEASMVGMSLWRDLRSLAEDAGVKILFVGDPFQLGPVEPDVPGRWSALDLETPHRAHLDQVVRQAAESPVLRAAMAVRTAASKAEAQAALRGLPRAASPEDAWHAAAGGPVLVHTNALRNELNGRLRAAAGIPAGTDPRPGEPLLVLKNNYALDRFNGEVVDFEAWATDLVEVGVTDRRANRTALARFGVAEIEGSRCMLSPDEVRGRLELFREHFVAKASKRAFRRLDQGDVPPHLHAAYGYCLSTHKSQGSQWDKVSLVLEPTIDLGREDGRRLVYTALTRARLEVYWTKCC